MKMSAEQIERIKGLGYTESEALFTVAFRRTATGTLFGSGRMSRAKKNGREYERKSARSTVQANSQHPNGNTRPRK
jgi:hypothetical protein